MYELRKVKRSPQAILYGQVGHFGAFKSASLPKVDTVVLLAPILSTVRVIMETKLVFCDNAVPSVRKCLPFLFPLTSYVPGTRGHTYPSFIC